MPVDPSIIAGAAAVVGQGVNMYSQGKTNRNTRKHIETMYNAQRNAALEDWNRQNEYNHPSAQMARLREAGLNPNLVYGDGAKSAADPIRSTQSQQWSPHAPQVDTSKIGEAVGTMYDVKVKQAQADNLRTQNTVMEQDKLLKAAQTNKTLQDTEAGKFDLALKGDLRQNSLEIAKMTLSKLGADTQFTLDQNTRAATQLNDLLKNSASMRGKTAAEIREISAKILHLRATTKGVEYDNGLKALGIQPHDSPTARAIQTIVGGLDPKTLKQDFWGGKPGGWQKGDGKDKGAAKGTVGNKKKRLH